MEYIFYYNCPPQGYGFYERSKAFPESYLEELQQICNYMPEPVSNSVALRYAPVRDRYLLTVIFRQPAGVGAHTRGVNTAVNLLMNGEEADAFFSRISQQELNDTVRRAVEMLKSTEEQVEVPVLPLSDRENVIPGVQLLTAASYAGARALGKQAYFGLETPVLKEVEVMLRQLPLKLRKQISFHTDIQSVRESIGIAVNFCSFGMLDDARRDGMVGGMNSTYKYLYAIDKKGNCESWQADAEGFRKYKDLRAFLQNLPCPELTRPLLVENASSWMELESLPEVESGKDLLESLLDKIPPRALLKEVQSGRLSEDTVMRLAQCSNLPEELFTAIIQNEKTSENTLLELTEVLPESAVVTIVESGRLSEASLSRLSGAKRMRLVAKTAQKELRKMRPVRERHVEQRRIPEERPRPVREEHKERPKLKINVLSLMKGIGKLVLLGGLIWGFVALAKSLLTVSSVPEAEQVMLLIRVDTINSLWKILGLTALSAALSSFITYHITKWMKEKK